MHAALAERENNTAVARPLKVLVPLIHEELEAGDNAGLEHYRRAGEMLIEAKEQVDHGDWSSWLKRNFHRSSEQARAYIKLAIESQKAGRPVFSTLSEVTHPHRVNHQPQWHASVNEAVRAPDMEHFRRQQQNEREERRLEHELALKLIKIGYRVLAAELHPDRKGGSAQAMARLNRVRKILEGAM